MNIPNHSRLPAKLRQKPTALAVGMFASLLATTAVHAGPGYTDSTSATGVAGRIQTFFANSPSGPRAAIPIEVTATYDNVIGSGTALRKFVDPLPVAGAANAKLMADGVTSKYIPVAVPQKWVNPKGVATTDDYYELAVVEYTDRFHSDLKKPTTLRGYVQLSTALNPGKAIPLTYPDGTPIMIQATDATGKLMFAAGGVPVKVQAKAVDTPHYLGPIINATKGIATRIKFHNLLPVGRAQLNVDPVTGAPVLDAAGHVTVTKRNGDLFLPVDSSLAGAGYGADGVYKFTQNRVALHVHGADAPWVSSGSALQWFTPAAEADPLAVGSLAAQIPDPTILPSYLRGASAVNVPDMNDAGPGAYTYYFANQQSARMLWMQDQAQGTARLNTYAGMVSLYNVTDPSEQDLITRKIIPGPTETIPLVLQDKSFTPDDIALQDARWNTTAWGAAGDLWFPHVYETVQDPAQKNNWNPVGRWNYGPWYWPVFPAFYTLPTGNYNDETVTPDAWGDTPVVNGVAYPVLAVEPKAYRFRILNASNDRMLTFNLFTADTTRAAPFDATNFSEVAMIPASPPTNPCAPGAPRSTLIGATYCVPDSWAFDGRVGGVPDPATQGPTIYQIGHEGGFLPQVVPIDPAPSVPLYDVGRVTVLNLATSGLFMAPSERADVVIDFSAYAGKTLIAYNDMYTPLPMGDQRTDYFTGVGDQSKVGGAEDTKVGYGPNTRTLMQFKVAAATTTAGIAFNPTTLATEVSKAYGASQERPIVAQSAYNPAFGTAWTDAQAWANIFTGTLKQPMFNYVSGGTGVFNGVTITAGGSGYTTAPTVAITGGGATTSATGVATLKINAINVVTPGSGYLVAPAVTFTTAPGYIGTGAQANATLGVATVTVTSGGSGYTTAPVVTFSMPQIAGGVQAKGTATVLAGKVTAINITTAGSGYVGAPVVTVAPPTTGTRATATTTGGLASVILTAPDPANPATAGGAGYNDLINGLTIGFTAPTGANPVAPTAAATGTVLDVSLTSPGIGYTALPTITLTGGGGTGARATGSLQGAIQVKTKTIQELFDASYGRYNYTLGIELPFTTAAVQTTIPLGFIDPPTEGFGDGEVQIWKIVSNGLFTQPFILNIGSVQLLNRVGWDGFVAPPAPNELGWKETIRVNPLEDTVIAVRPKKPVTPGFGVPNSVRLLDPTQPLASPFGFTQVDPNSGLAATVLNAVQNFGAEYTWQNSIGSHEVNDFRRPIVFDGKETVPTAATGLTATPTLYVAGVGGVTLAWTDTSSTEYKFDILRATVPARGAVAAYTTVGSAPANGGSFFDTSALPSTAYTYQVVAVGANGSSAVSNTATVTTPIAPPLAPTTVIAKQTLGTAISVSWLDTSNNETAFQVQSSVDGGVTWTALPNVTRTAAQGTSVGTTVTATTTGVLGSTYLFRVAAQDAGGASAWAVSAPLIMIAPPVAPTSVSAAITTGTTVGINWVDASTTETAFVVQRATVSAAGVVGAFATLTGGTVTSATGAATGTALSFLDTTAVNGVTYQYCVAAQNVGGNSACTASANVPIMIVPVAPSGVVATATGASVAIKWVDNSTDETSFVVTGSVDGGAPVAVGTVAVRAGTAGTTGTTINLAPAYAAKMGGTWVFSVVAIGPGGTSAAAASAPVVVAGVPAAPTALTGVAFSGTQVNLSWTNSSTVETGFVVQRATVAANGTVGAFATVTGGTLASTAALGAAVTFSDTTAVNGTTYQYRVAATNASGSSTYVTSANVAVMFVPTAPTLVNAVATGSSVAISWTDNSTDETSFVVTGSLNGGAAVAVGTLTVPAGAARTGTGTVVNLPAYNAFGGTWVFSVVAVGPGGTSAAATSAPVVVTAPPVLDPGAVTATIASATQVTVGWTDLSTNETSFTVQRATVTGGVVGAFATVGTVARTGTATTGTGTAVSFNDTTVVFGTTYVYQVQAASATALSNFVQSAQVALTVGAPTGVTVVPATINTARLSWVDGGALETGYKVERSIDGGLTWTVLTTTAANATTYTATGLAAGTVYQFRVTGVRVAGAVTYSSTSVIVSLTMAAPALAAAPTGVTVTGLTTTTATINWIDGSTNESSFIVQGCAGVCTAASRWTTYGTVASTGANVTGTGAALSFVDTGLTTKTTYSWRVVPMNGVTQGTPSAIVTATTL
ncbi:MAG: fibronectin type III domain-containing protein [Leptothrix sp. (in: b-proteobacteria)]